MKRRPSVTLGPLVAELRDAGLLVGTEGSLETHVTGVSQDTRRTRSGDLFLAWAGSSFDANDALAEAVRAGAVAAVVERPAPGLDIPQVIVQDGRHAAALAASYFHGHPWRELFLVGVTGTNGKTTTTLLVRSLLGTRGDSAAIGTLGLVQPNGGIRAGTEALTTPGPVDLASWMRALVDEGVRYLTMEVSSHALDQHRVDGLRFRSAVFTNLSRDHLDYHGSMEEYRNAKARLAELVVPEGTLVVNAEDPAWSGLAEGARGPRSLTFGFHPEATLRAEDVRADAHGTRFVLHHGAQAVPVALPLLGGFNVENALGAAGVGLAAGLELASIGAALEAAPQVPGRLERVVSEPFTVLIDYAHTPEALERVLSTLRPLAARRLLVLFGAGGDRDPGKRPRMGAAAARWADLCVVTSDNPRTEDPDAIIDDIVPGMGEGRVQRITDRREAIAWILDEAADGDVVLLAGKGHETYQVLGTQKHPFDERRIVRAHLGEATA